MLLKTKNQVEMAQFIREDVEEFVRTSLLNRIPGSDDFIFDKPLVGYADGDDSLFSEYKTIIDLTYLTPREAIAKTFNKNPEDMPEHLSVISWILPISGKIRESTRQRKRTPSRFWVYTRWYGEKFNNALREHVVKLLTDMGYLATAPAIEPYFFPRKTNERGYFSNWPEKHIAYVAGLGTFGFSRGLITECGISHRCGSVVTDLILPPSPRTAKSPYSNCLFYARGKCQVCVARCPAGALTENGYDKIKCWEYQSSDSFHRLLEKYEAGFAGSCGLCQTKVPCEFRNPTKSKAANGGRK